MGPGDIGCIMVFNKEKPMEEMVQLYHESKQIMGQTPKVEAGAGGDGKGE
eukprot:CAMPEP_0201586994 /NCGR_PEP_ID=MMETSP0190_2-20130828/138778_1 /ASSEMBLY_ACC=CAM_ASM_000263 /TAXON_ID=37353 /ORGANISM="Rosalina sp." /LENGTH=49 /DNA_ID= /DNA_START= /DNA_END= /DNA_ORIENTATION=